MSRPHQFIGSIPENYDRYLVPVIFEPYAASMATKVAELKPKRVLELACGTGAVTRCLVKALPQGTKYVATDFSPDMLEVAKKKLSGSNAVEWQQADACQLPFEDECFDVIVCQFGVMMFPDKAAAMSEAFRVLAPGGHLLTCAWSAREANRFFDILENTLTEMFPEEETPFMPTPMSMPDPGTHRKLAEDAGFARVDAGVETHRTGPHDAAEFAKGYTLGSPLGMYLGNQGYDLEKIQSAIAAAFRAELGDPMYCDLSAAVCHAVKGS
jgi:ubiquinone/menaquinone biosynthesis C-methylase UbiE